MSVIGGGSAGGGGSGTESIGPAKKETWSGNARKATTHDAQAEPIETGAAAVQRLYWSTFAPTFVPA
jgi:hypothetical protein